MNNWLLAAYAELGLEYYRLTKHYGAFDDVMNPLAEAEEMPSDPDVTGTISRLTHRLLGQAVQADLD
jgi:hypothetical protein